MTREVCVAGLEVRRAADRSRCRREGLRDHARAGTHGTRCLIVTSDSNHLAEVPEFQGPHFLEERDGLDVCWLRTLKSTRAKSLAADAQLAALRMGSAAPAQRAICRRPDVIIVSSLSLLTILSGIALRRRHRAAAGLRDPRHLAADPGGGGRLQPTQPRSSGSRPGSSAWVTAARTPSSAPCPTSVSTSSTSWALPSRPYCIPMGYAAAARVLPSESREAVRRRCTAPPAVVRRRVRRDHGHHQCARAALPGRGDAVGTSPSVHFLVLGDGGLLADYQRALRPPAQPVVRGQGPQRTRSAVLARCDVLYLSTLPVRGVALRPVAEQADRLHALRASQCWPRTPASLDDQRGRMWLVRTRRGRRCTDRRDPTLRRDER